ncbi:Ankyrin repeat domain-containing protein 13B [Liparis tanakae]|uniref:Ankyrin repeat domain-containing protein 13B n=1 Tax=Liparis tanakae TaxID=230148 RepID=A0A4Z2EP07_9TELE|nr:Ankyrin repeat domain-containing protein 13B [Liparis tanakae]
MTCPAITNPAALTAEEYFNPGSSPTQRDIGHPCQLTTKTQSVIVLRQSMNGARDVVPIIDLMAISNGLFAKLRDFITLRLPPGFPVMIASCRAGEIPPCVFEAPAGYSMLTGGKQRDSMRDEEEDLLQFAIQQSLLEAGSEYDQVSWEGSV